LNGSVLASVLANADEEFRPDPRVATTQANIGGRVVTRQPIKCRALVLIDSRRGTVFAASP
jgi:hypothetical protein